MRSVVLLSSILAVSAGVAFAFGCSAPEEGADTNEAAATAAEISMARAAIAVIAGAQAKCNQCHTASKTDVLRWGQAMQNIENTCLSPSLTLTPEQRVLCLRENPTDPASAFTAGKLGLY